MNKQVESPGGVTIHPATQMGMVALGIADLDRSVHFYQDVLGFKLLDHTSTTATLGVATATPLLHLTRLEGARPRPVPTTGLYHFAILVPSRLDLAQSLRRLVEMRYSLQGASDHLVSEALYLADPDGIGIEIYRDRPRASWPRQGGRIQMATDPLDLHGILAELHADPQPWAGLEPGTRIGHMHLQVADQRAAEAFYAGVLGFEIMVRMPGASFLSAGGYHHHLGLNTWQSRGASPPPADAVGLRSFTISLPDQAEQEQVIARLDVAGVAWTRQGDTVELDDPWHNRIVLTIG